MTDKIDLEELMRVSEYNDEPPIYGEEIRALVHAVRAARNFDHAITSAVTTVDLSEHRRQLHAALTVFTDSSDGTP